MPHIPKVEQFCHFFFPQKSLLDWLCAMSIKNLNQISYLKSASLLTVAAHRVVGYSATWQFFHGKSSQFCSFFTLFVD